jgi:hypothetical protein
MSDQGTSEPGWYPDPYSRHEHRYWDGASWTDQVSDGGQVGTDPPTEGPPPAAEPATAATPAAAPAAEGGRKVPVGVLALVGLGVAALVVVLVLFVFGGDDEGGTGDFAGTISEDEPVEARQLDLEAGEALRVVVTPDDDLDPRLTLSIDPQNVGDLVESLVDLSDFDDDQAQGAFSDEFDDLFSDAVEDEDLSADLSQALSDDYSDFTEQLAELDEDLAGAGVPILIGSNFTEQGDPAGGAFVAPVDGTYTVLVTGVEHSEGEFEGRIETEAPAESFDPDDLDPDEEIDSAAFFEQYGEHREFFCDEDFYGDDPEDVLEQAEQLCDEEAFEELLSDLSDLSGDFSTDFSDDFSTDFSDDFSTDFSDDFSDVFSDDFSDDLTLGEPVPPEVYIIDFGSVRRFDRLANSCFNGNLADCDQLFAITPVADAGSYEDYGGSCGGRLLEQRPGQCASLG